MNQYHLHPETKFQNGDYLDCGFTERRHVLTVGIEHIGKEANRLEEQWFLGADDEAQVSYVALLDKNLAGRRENLIKAHQQHGLNALAVTSAVSPRHVSRVLRAQVVPSRNIADRILKGIQRLGQAADEKAMAVARLRIRAAAFGLRRLAKAAGMDPSNLSQMLRGSRVLRDDMRRKLEALLNGTDRRAKTPCDSGEYL